MNEGKIFECYWKKSIPDDVYYLRIKDSASSFGQDSEKSRFTPKNPYDCFVFYNGFLFPMELKSTEGTSISIQRNRDEKSKMIKLNQIEGLTEANKFNNIISGFIFDFRGSETYWISIDNFKDFIENTDKKSINEKDVIKYKGIIISKSKKRTRYTYDIKKLLTDIIRGENNNGKKNEL